MAERHELPTVVFVAGASRSGSTVLDIALGSNPDFVSVGELRRLQGYARRDHELSGARSTTSELRCTCGAWVDECTLWLSVEREAGLSFRESPFKSSGTVACRRAVQAAYLIAGPRAAYAAAASTRCGKRELAVARNCFRVYDAIGAVTGSRYIVDSSKSIYHYALLRSHDARRVRLILLARDGRAVTHSMIRGDRATHWPAGVPPATQAARDWARQTRSMRLLSRRTPSSEKVTLRYEELCSDPAREFERIARMLGAPSLEPQLASDVRHNIGGSPSRLERHTEIRLDERWRDDLSESDLAMFERVAGATNRRMGYC